MRDGMLVRTEVCCLCCLCVNIGIGKVSKCRESIVVLVGMAMRGACREHRTEQAG